MWPALLSKAYGRLVEDTEKERRERTGTAAFTEVVTKENQPLLQHLLDNSYCTLQASYRVESVARVHREGAGNYSKQHTPVDNSYPHRPAHEDSDDAYSQVCAVYIYLCAVCPQLFALNCSPCN